MSTYVTLMRWTPQGIANVKGSLQRLEDARKRARAAGGDIKAAYFTMGQFDAVIISEAPNDEAASRNALAAGMLGFVRTETSRAYTEEEFKNLLGTLP